MKSINKEILRLAIPNIISNISIPLLSTVDTILMGHLSSSHLGAVGIGGMLFNFIYWNFGFLRMGTTGLTAQAYGADNPNQIANTLARSIGLAIAIAILIILFHRPIGEASAFLLNVSPQQFDMVISYFTIRIFAAPATMLIYGFKGWFFGMQNAVYPLVMTVIVNVSNILISAYLVLYLDWKIEGVAWGTVIAQYIGLGVAVLLYTIRYRVYNTFVNWNSIMKVAEIKEFFKINSDLFLRTVCLTFAFGFFYSQSSKAGELVLAANIILQQFLNWMSYGVDGFAHASESLVGKYKGAQNIRRLKDAIKYSFYWGAVFASGYSVVYFLFGELLLGLFSNETEVIQFTKNYLLWVVFLPLVAFQSYIWDGIYVGLSASKSMRNSMFISLGIYLISYYLLYDHINGHALWLALFIFLLGRACTQQFLYARHGHLLD